MPPPLVNAYLKDQITRIKERVSAESIKSLRHVKNISMEEAIKDWVAGLTPLQASRMYGITEIIQLAQLKGKFRELPAKQMVATALYKAGFIQTRLWGKGLRNRRFWSYEKEISKP